MTKSNKIAPSWRSILTLSVLAAVAVVGFAYAESLAVQIGLALITAALAFAVIYNARVRAARSTIELAAGTTAVDALAVGVLTPSWIWSGTNGVVIATAGEEVLAARVTLRHPELLLQSSISEASVAVASGKFSTSTVTLDSPGARVSLRTAPAMANALTTRVRQATQVPA